jgi:uncharacterized membrane protein YfcA
MPYADWGFLAAVTLFAAAVQSATGFGFAIVAVPLYLLILNSLSAVQVAIVVTPVISLAVVPRLWPEVRGDLLGRLMGGSVLGLPVGMVVYAYAGLFWIKTAVAVLIVLFALLFFLKARAPERRGGDTGGESTGRATPARGREVAVGVLSGAMTTSLGMPGPPVMLYFSALNLERNTVRATLLSLFVFSYAGAAAVQAAVAGIALQTWIMAGVLAPCALVGAALGHWLSRGMSQRVFQTGALLLLVGTGLYMLYGTFSGG